MLTQQKRCLKTDYLVNPYISHNACLDGPHSLFCEMEASFFYHIFIRSILFNPFTPEILKWAHPCLNSDTSFVQNRDLQSTLIISTSLIWNIHLSRSEILVPVLTWKSKNRYENIVEKRRNCSYSSFPQYFQYISNFRSQITYSFVKCGCLIYWFPYFRNSDISRYGYLEVFQRGP